MRSVQPIEDFGVALLETEDLDPIYVALSRVDWSVSVKERWLVAYWLFYDAGFACLATGAWARKPFWDLLAEAAANDTPAPVPGGGRWPRGPERRHFRGANATKAIDDLRWQFGPTEMVADAFGNLDPDGPYEFEAVAKRIKRWPQFGPWAAFKVADMLERCLNYPISFDRAAVFMFDQPKKAALRVWEERAGGRALQPVDAVRQVVDHLLRRFADYEAPGGGRRVGLQEVETVLCKWKSHANGRYAVGHDIDEIRRSLGRWMSVTAKAADFVEAMPRRVDDQ